MSCPRKRPLQLRVSASHPPVGFALHLTKLLGICLLSAQRRRSAGN
ncbi:hypothetical protein LINPERPRIM_LOCUS31256 [Linum perenne]